MSAHTPGPWAVNWAGSGRDGKFVYDEVYVYAPLCGVEDIAVAADIADPLTGKPSAANARLIAAAPELLAALQRLIASDEAHETIHAPDGDDIARMVEYEAAFDNAREVLAKATHPINQS